MQFQHRFHWDWVLSLRRDIPIVISGGSTGPSGIFPSAPLAGGSRALIRCCYRKATAILKRYTGIP